MAGSLRTKVTKVTPLAAAGAALLLRAGPGLPGAASVRPFSGSSVFLVATKKKTTAVTKKKVVAKKKPVVKKKKTAAKKPVAKKKKKTVLKKKKVVPKKKKVAAKRTTRKLTPEQKEARMKKLKKAKQIVKIRELKQTALLKEEPRAGATSPWIVYSNTHGPALREGGTPFTAVFTKLAEQFKALPEAELENLRVAGKSNHDAYVAKYGAWIKKYTPAQISAANKARGSLKRLGIKARFQLRDSRLPKRNMSSWVFYASERLKARTDGATVADAMRTASGEWKAMTPAQKKPYEEMATQDRKRWESQSKVAFGS